MEYKNKLITLSDGIQYVILKNLEYDGYTYVLANEIVDGELGTDVSLFRIEKENDQVNFVLEKDLSKAEKILVDMSH